MSILHPIAIRAKHAFILSFALVAISSRVLAEEPAADPPAESTSPTLRVGGLGITGYADLTYEYLSSAGEFSSGTPSRVFDFRDDRWAVHQAAFTAALQPTQGFGGLVNVTAGRDAPVIKSYPDTGSSEIDLTQAYLQYATGPLTVIGGKFVTLAGVEVIAEPQNTNFSRSILFGYAIPYTHTGLRVTDAIDEQWGMTIGVNNGWDQISADRNGQTLELGGTWTPSKRFTTVINAYVGKEPVNSTTRIPDTERDLVDIILSWNVNEAMTLILNYDWGRQAAAAADGSAARWDGVAGYLNYRITPRWRASLRLETFDDRDGFRTGVNVPQFQGYGGQRGQVWSEETLTVGFIPTEHVELRVEARNDHSSAHAIVTSGCVDAVATCVTDQQRSVAVQALFKF